MTGAQDYRRRVTREEAGGRVLETWIVEAPSVNGGYDALLQVEEETIRLDEQTTRVTRREFASPDDGRRVLMTTIEEERVEDPGGHITIRRDVTEQDTNGRGRPTRQETETTTPGPNGTFETEALVLRPGINRTGFVPTERVVETGRRDDEGRTIESDRTAFADGTGRGSWQALERRTVTRRFSPDGVETDETVYRPDSTGRLTINERIVTRERTDTGGGNRLEENVYSTDIPGERTLREPELLRQVTTTRSGTGTGGWESIREVREARQGRFRVVERETEIGNPGRNGDTDVSVVIERLDANGRLAPVLSTTTRLAGQ